MTTGAGSGTSASSASNANGAGGGATAAGNANAASSADAYRQSSSASPRGVVSGGYCGSSASTPHSHSTSGSYSVANPYTGSPTLYTSRKFSSWISRSSAQASKQALHLWLALHG